MQISVIFDPLDEADRQRAGGFIVGLKGFSASVQTQAAPAATSAPAPAATTAPAPAATSNKFPPMTGTPDMTDLDVHGRPWDGRIHAKTKTKNKDGSWKYGKGVQKDTPDLIVHVNAQLDALGGTPTTAPAPVTVETAMSAPAPVPGTPAPTPAPPAPVAPPAPAQTLEPEFQALVDKQNRILEGGIAITPGSYEHYKIPADYGPAAALGALYEKWTCQTIDDIYAKGAQCWAELMPCLNYIWAE